MRRILFFSENFCGPEVKGGLEVATYRIAKALKEEKGIEAYAAFRSKTFTGDKSIYEDIIKLSGPHRKFQKDLAQFISEKRIDIVVNMSRFYRHKDIVRAVETSGKTVKIFFMQHFAPGSEIKKPTFSSGFHLLKLNPYNPLYWLRSTVYPLLKLPRRLKFSKVYRETYEDSDKIILLSEGYIEDYCRIGKLKDKSKFKAIPNIFLQSGNPEFGMEQKKKRVLILSRMDEIQKRISLALEIWKEIEKDPDLNDWHLDIVGSGHNSDIVKRLIKKYNLRNVTLHGWQPREKFLQESSILISTSEYEGLPLSILEAQAYGVVPIVFGSYASVFDVISNYENGVIVENFGDVTDFSKKLKDLMYNEDYRTELSRNSSNSMNRFSPEQIAKQWIQLL